MNEQRQRGRRNRRKSKQTVIGWTADKVLKATVWYTIITLAFRCPTAQKDLKDDSPRICKPSLQLRDAVTPYTQPYIDQYLSPYLKQVQPYIDQFNAKVYEPGLAAYQQHGAPRVANAQKYGQQQWQRTVKPQLEVLQKQTGKQYQALLGPHVKRAQDVVQPYYDSVRTSAGDIWELELEPVYRKTKPYAEMVYQQGQEFAVKTALPQAQFVGGTAWTFWTRQIWPRLRILYGENVEPQLLRITERLGRYKDGKKLEAEIKSIETSSKLSEASSSASSIASSISSSASKVSATPSSAASIASSAASEAAASKSTENPSDQKKQFQADLKNWETLCATAVDEGSEDLKERIQDITDTQIKSADGVGGALVTQLEQTTESAFNSVKARIQQIVRNLPHDAEQSHIDDANEELVTGIRAAGQNIKQRAQAVREWRQTKDAETAELIEKAVQSTLETIEHIRDLRLTEIGRTYASSSLPHKEWTKYNDLKKATQAWRKDVKKSAHNHAGIAKARAANEDIEHQAMAIAEDAAKELGRLKEVGKWKIAADEDSDDFSTRYVPPPVRKAKEQIVEMAAQASQAVLGEETPTQGSVESVASVATEKFAEGASKVSAKVAGSVAPAAEKAASSASQSVQSGASKISEKVLGSSTGSVESAASKISEKVVGSEEPAAKKAASSVSASADSAASKISEKVVGSTGSVESAASKVSEAVIGSSTGSAESAISKISEKVVDSDTPVIEIVASSASSSAKSLSSKASKSAKIAASSASSAVTGGSSLSDSASDAASVVSASVYSAASNAASRASSASSVKSEKLYSDGVVVE